ncbi:M16 family metallopeptidase, partial [Cribrihabitans sp. XS_ASV171]
LRTTLHEPRFDQDAIDRVRAQVISGLKSDATDPNSIAGETLSQLVYDDHPYATEGKGTIASVAALTREDIAEAKERVFARDRLYVSAVGDITAEELGVMLDELLADLPETSVPLPEAANVTIPEGRTVVDFDTPQSVALFVQEGIERDDPDFFAAYILNHIIGGGSFESRLMTEVREKRGLTYGIYSYLLPKDHAALYMGSVASSNDRIAETISVVRDEWRKAAEEGVTAEELEAAKTYLTGAYPLRFDGNSQIAGIMVGMQMQGLPIDYIATRNDKVNAVTLEEINRVARELLDPEGLHFVVVGQPQGLDG